MMSMVEAMMAAADAATKPLVVFIVFFGELPPWLPLTLTSMAMNARVQFVVVGDAAPPPVIPQNVRFEQISYPAMQSRLAKLIEADVRYNWTYKGNDIKPAAPALYPHLVAGYEWWAWADLDVVFGDLLRFMELAARRPACCKVPLRRDGTPKSKRLVNVYHHRDACPCTNGESINVVCPLYPNPWSKKAWGPFTAFRVGFGSELFRQSPQWRAVLGSNEYAHFDEWWGPFHYSRGWETMGDVLTRLAEDVGSVVMSKQKMPFAEAKSCRDGACMFCPCGALRLRLEPAARRLVVNEREVMLLHLAESKRAWLGRGVSLPPWAPAAAGADAGCTQVRGLGRLNASCGAACSARAPIFTDWATPGAVERATRLGRHRVETKWAGHIKYDAAAELSVGECGESR